MIESSVRNEAIRRGRVQGRPEGQRAEDRRVCLDLVRQSHPRLVSKPRGSIPVCTDGKRPRTRILRAPRLSDADFAGFVLGDGH